MTLPADLLPVAREAVATARRIIRSRAPGAVRPKGERDMVTDLDLAVEEAVRDFLARETPEIGVLGEEHGRSGPDGGARWWALDPVDGTANLARGMPLCAVSLALVEGGGGRREGAGQDGGAGGERAGAERGRGVLAAIDLPFLDVCYTAVAGRGAYADGERVHASGVRDLAEAVISIGDFARGPGAEEKNRVRIALLDALGGRAQRIRMFGTAAIDLAWVAHGKLDASVILANMPWDTLAGVLLVRESGGAVLDQDGTQHSTASTATVAICPGLTDTVLGALHRARADA